MKGIDLHDHDINIKDSSDTDMSSETEDDEFPEPLISSFNSESIKFPEDKIKTEGELRWENYKEVFQNDYNNLYEKTKKQLLNPILMHHRAGQTTASIAPEMYQRNVEITSQSLLNKIT